MPSGRENTLKLQHLACKNTWFAQTLGPTLEILQSDRTTVFFGVLGLQVIERTLPDLTKKRGWVASCNPTSLFCEVGQSAFYEWEMLRGERWRPAKSVRRSHRNIMTRSLVL